MFDTLFARKRFGKCNKENKKQPTESIHTASQLSQIRSGRDQTYPA